jgi:hypothetical protein
MRKTAVATRLGTLLLSIILLMPDPALALRQLNAGTEEDNPVTRKLAETLLPTRAGNEEVLDEKLL